jgi:hypothetical protein
MHQTDEMLLEPFTPQRIPAVQPSRSVSAAPFSCRNKKKTDEEMMLLSGARLLAIVLSLLSIDGVESILADSMYTTMNKALQTCTYGMNRKNSGSANHPAFVHPLFVPLARKSFQSLGHQRQVCTIPREHLGMRLGSLALTRMAKEAAKPAQKKQSRPPVPPPEPVERVRRHFKEVSDVSRCSHQNSSMIP